MKNHGWTENDIQRLREYAENGCSVYRRAGALKRTVNSVKTKAARYGLRLACGKTYTQILKPKPMLRHKDPGAYTAMPVQTASAQSSHEYKYCLYEGRSGGAGDCSFQTFAQCQASASGRVADSPH